MAKKRKSFNAQNEKDAIRLRQEEISEEAKEKQKQMKRIKRFARRAEQRGYDVSNINFDDLTELTLGELKKIKPSELYSQIEYVLKQGDKEVRVSGTTGRKLEYLKAYEKGYYTRPGHEYVPVEPDYQPIFTGVIDRFRAWLEYNDYEEYKQGSQFFSGKRTSAVKNLQFNLEYILEAKSYIEQVLEDLISEKGESAVATIIMQNASEIQQEQDLITYKGPSDSNVTRASANTIVEILMQSRSIKRSKEISDLEEEYDFDEGEY